MPTGCSTGKNHSSMRASSRQKKGSSGRKDQKGKGNKVHGGGRWQGSSSGKPYRLCFASRGQARRKDTPANQSPQERAREAEDPPKTSDWRQGIRQRLLRKSLRERGINLLSLIDAITGMSTDKMTAFGIDTGDDIQLRELSVGSETFDA